MTDPKPIDWSGVHAALDQYYATKPVRDAMLDDVKRNADVDRWEAAEKDAGDLVREAYYAATSDRNSRTTIMQNLTPWDAVRTSKYPVPEKYIPTGERSPVAPPWKG